MPATFILYARKVVNNPLLRRKQVQVQLIHPEMPNVSKTAIKDKLADMFKAKSEAIGVFGLHTAFGGGRSTGFALIYDSLDDRKKCDQKKLLKRDGLAAARVRGRKQLKEIKGRVRRVRGTAKAKATNAGNKKK